MTTAIAMRIAVTISVRATGNAGPSRHGARSGRGASGRGTSPLRARGRAARHSAGRGLARARSRLSCRHGAHAMSVRRSSSRIGALRRDRYSTSVRRPALGAREAAEPWTSFRSLCPASCWATGAHLGHCRRQLTLSQIRRHEQHVAVLDTGSPVHDHLGVPAKLPAVIGPALSGSVRDVKGRRTRR